MVVKALVQLSVAGAATCVLVGPAQATHSLIPPNTTFQLIGKAALGPDAVVCSITMSGVTSPAGTKNVAGQITGASLVKPSKKCSELSFAGFPWRIRIDSKYGGSISNIDFTINGEYCHEAPVALRIFKSGDWAFSASPGCNFLGGFKSTPLVTVER